MKRQALPYAYALVTIAATFLVGQLILWLVPDSANAWASVLFILMNLLPMLIAFAFARGSGEMSDMGQVLGAAFSPRERYYAYLAALAVPLVYYGTSALLGNVTPTGSPLSAAIAYLPWTLLQGGLEEVGWRWYLQPRMSVGRSFALKMLVISVIWFAWHIPIYRLPWVSSASTNGLALFLMLLGNTFALGAVRELSRGALPCVAAHMLLNTAAACVSVESDVAKVAVLAGAEAALSLAVVGLFEGAAGREGRRP